MICTLCRWLMPTVVQDDLPFAICDRVRQHCEKCDACSAVYRDQVASWDALREASARDTPPSLPTDFTQRVMDRIANAAPAVSQSYRRVVAWSAAAVLALAALGGIYNQFDNRPTPEMTARQEADIVDGEDAGTGEPFTAADLAAMMSRLRPNREMTDIELARKYPVVENIRFPDGTQVVFTTNEPHITIVWVLSHTGERAL